MAVPKGKNKLTKWFIRCILTYISIFILALAMILVLYRQFYFTAQQTIMTGYKDKLESAVTAIDNSFQIAITSANTFKNNHSITRLASSTPDTLKSAVVDMRESKAAMQQTHTLLGNEFVAEFMLYSKNNYLITNFIVSNDYRNEYDNLFSFTDIDALQWYLRITDKERNTPFLLHSMELNSLYQSNCPRSVLPLVVPVYSSSGSVLYTIMYLIDSQWCTDLITGGDGLINSIRDDSGALLLGEEIPESGYISIDAVSAQIPSYKYTTAIPVSLIADNLSRVTSIIKIYVICGLAGILILSIVYAARNIIGMRPLLSHSEVSPNGYRSPYRYANDLLETISETRDMLQKKLLLVENTYTNNMLENVLRRGVASSEDYALLTRTLNYDSSPLYVAVFRPDEAACDSVTALQSETAFEESFTVVTLHSTPVETIFIIKDASMREILDVSQVLAGQGRIGISNSVTDLHSLHSAYQKACLALSSGTGRICTQNDANSVFTPTIDIEMLSALRNMILTGRSEEIDTLFDRIEKNTVNLVGIDSLQLFFVIRQLILRSEQQISADVVGNDESLPCILDEKNEEGLERLRTYALDLSKRTKMSGSKDDTALYNSIISLIERDFSMPDLSARYISEKLKCSLKSIYQSVSQYSSLTVSDIIENTRLHFAMELLRNTDKTNEEISNLCGFGTMNTFYRVFKKRYSISPGEWRHKENNSYKMN